MADIDVHNANRGEIIIYRAEDNTIQLDVRMENETVWLTQDQMALLFQRDKSVIARHISNIYSEGELQKESTVAKNATVQIEGGVRLVPFDARKGTSWTEIIRTKIKTNEDMAGKEVSPKRLAEYRAIRKKVDAKAKRRACKEHGLPASAYSAALIFSFWEHKKRILREEYHMRWRDESDLHPDRLY